MNVPSADADAIEAKQASIAPLPPLDGFTAQEFRARREALRTACSDGIVLVRGGAADEIVNPGVFRQNSNFFYLTGVDTPGAFLVLLPPGFPGWLGIRGLPDGNEEILFLPARNPGSELWSGPQLGPGKETEQATGIGKVADTGGLWNVLSIWLQHCPLLYTVSPYGELAQRTPDFALMQRVGQIAPMVQFRDVSPAIANLRMIKSHAELDRIRQAVAISAEGQRAAQALISNGVGRSEYEVEAAIFEQFRKRGARLAFASIVGGGINGTILHYEENCHPLRSGDAVVVDIGAYFGHYCGDLTRTYPVGGNFNSRQQEIYSLVSGAIAHTVKNFRPGEDTLRSLNDRCKEYLKSSPLRAVDSAGAEHTMDHFMPHGLSHHLGLDVHDVGDRTSVLRPGSVITIEPGIYIASESLGVRLEDDYLVTETGLECMVRDLTYD